MRKTSTTRYDVAEHLRTPEEMAAYLEACLEDAEGDAALIAKALGDIARARRRAAAMGLCSRTLHLRR
jgi:probable addiction module antidote protein